MLYAISVLPSPNRIFLDIENMIYQYLGNRIQHKMKITTIYEYQKGGNCTISLKYSITTQNLTWIKSQLKENNKLNHG